MRTPMVLIVDYDCLALSTRVRDVDFLHVPLNSRDIKARLHCMRRK